MTAAALPSLVLEAALRGAAVFLAVALAIPLLRRRSAAVRHAAWTFAVGAQLALPALALVAPAWRVPLLRPPAWAASLVGTHSAPDAAAPRVEPPRAPSPAPVAGAVKGGGEPERAEPGPGTLAMFWWAGAGLILLQLAVGSIGVWRLAARGSRVLDAEWLARAHELAVRIGISRPLTLLRGDSLAVPVTWGVVYPVLLLPPGAESWDDEQRRYVLVHEMAHIRRFDALTELMGQVTLALFWFNPLVWLAVSRMRAERERACDDYVLRAGTTPSRYASDLLAMIRALSRPGNRSAGPAFAALAMARRTEFEGRMVAILDDGTDRKPLTGVGLAGGTLAAVVAGLALAGLDPLAANADASLGAPSVRVPVPPAVRVAAVDSGPAAAADPAPGAVQSASPRETATIRKPVTAPPRAQTGGIDRVLASMRQDGDKAAVLANYARSGNDTLLAAAMRAVPSLSRDGEKSVVLAHAAAGALRGDPRLRDAFFAAAESIGSDPDRSLVLVHATANARGSPAVAERVLRAAAGMRSSEASTVLMNVAQRRLVTSDPLRALYLGVANAMPSEGDRQRALLALAMAASARAPANR